MPVTITANHRACAAIWAAGARKQAEAYRTQAEHVRVERARAFYRRKAAEMDRMAERYEEFAGDVDITGITPSYEDLIEASGLILL